MRTANLAVMFADLAGYTQRTSEQSYEQNAAMLQRFSGVVSAISRSFGGRVVKQMGDGALIVFPSPTRAVEAAMSIQDRVAETNRAQGKDEHLNLRIGINVGEVRLERGDVFGDAVNVAARIEAETPVGEIYVSGTTYMTMNRSGLLFESVGTRELKGVDEAVPLFAVRGCATEAESRFPLRGTRRDDDGLPYRGRHLSKLRANRRRVRRRAAAGTAVAACLAILAVQYGFRAVKDYRQEKAALTKVAAGRLLQAVDDMAQGGVVASSPVVDALLAAADRSNNPASVCAIMDQLERLGRGSALRRNQLRVKSASQLAIIGELAQARGCLPIGMDPNTKEGREVALVNIHFDAAEALQQHNAKALRENLLRYEEFLREGTAAPAHLALISEHAAQGYLYRPSRPVADSLVVEFLHGTATGALAELARSADISTSARNWLVARLEDIGQDAPIDWLAVYGAQLQEDTCSARRVAISGLRHLGHLTAVGLLQREVAQRDSCTYQAATEAVSHLVQRGTMPQVGEPELLATR